MGRVFAFVLCFACVNTLRAQDDSAREEFIRGAQLYQAEDYEGALEAFRASYEIAPVPVVLFNIAQALRFLNRPAESISAFHEYLESEQNVDAERRTAVETAMSELEAQLAAVRIVVNAPGAEVFVGDRRLGTSPFGGPVYVGAGRHRFRATREGYLPTERSMTLQAGQNTNLRLEMEREPEEGVLIVRASVAGALVFIDDRRAGPAPLERVLSGGEHELMVEVDGYRDYEETVQIRDEEETEVLAEMEARDPIIDRWWFWTAIGGAALVAVIITLIATVPNDPQPLEGSLPNVRALHLQPSPGSR